MQTTSVPSLTTHPPIPVEEPQGVELASQLLQSFAEVPTIGRGWGFPASDGINVLLQLSQRNLPANSQRKYLTSFSMNEAALEHGEVHTSLSIELRDVVLIAPSPSGKRQLIVRPGNGDTSAILEIWDRIRLIREIHVPSALHGSVFSDGWFATGAAWSADESRVAYVAEAPIATKTPEWGCTKGPNGKKIEGAGPKGWTGRGEFVEDWGELNTGKRAPTLFVLEIQAGEVIAVQGLPENSSFGQPVWSRDGTALVFVAWEHQGSNFPAFPGRLGIVYCFNRPCALYAVAWPQPKERGTAVLACRLTPSSMSSAFSPRFTPDGKTLVFLSQHAAVQSGVHNGTPALLSLPWRAIDDGSTAIPTSIVDGVWRPADLNDFPGMYTTVLPEQPFIGEHQSSIIVATVQWRSNTAIVAVNLDGTVTRVTPANGASWSLTACQGDWIIATESHPGQPFRLYACHVTERERSTPDAWSWSCIALPGMADLTPAVQEALAATRTEVIQVQPTSGNTDVPFEAVIIRRHDIEGPLPTIVSPHGGPHSCYSAQFFMPFSFHVALGYCVVLVNYRGSTGFGEESVQSLPGHIGTHDVADCMAALDAVIEAGHADPKKVAAVGGSHGGFLSAHLVGQYPDRFRAVVLRNPVCNLATMVQLTDIPDWCFVEAMGTDLGKARAGVTASAEDIARFMQVSPVSYVGHVTAPLLMLLGACDRRVPLDDGKRYFDALRSRANAPETKLIVFSQDSHALDKPQTEFEQWINVYRWLELHLAS